MPVQVDLIQLGEEPLAQTLAEPEEALRLVGHASAAELARLAEADDPRDVQSSGAEAPLVAAAVHRRRQPHTRALCAHVERADALRAVHLVRRQREEVDVHSLDVNWELTHTLRRVRVEEDSLLARDAA